MNLTNWGYLQDLILKPVRIAVSKPAQQTYLNTILFMVTSTILLGIAVIGYILFYFNYIPQIGIERVIHLQYGLVELPSPFYIPQAETPREQERRRKLLTSRFSCSDGPHPYGLASLDSSLVSQQAYDIYLSLSVPRSPPNLEAGNFMLSLSLLSPTYKPPNPLSPTPITPHRGPSSTITSEDILFLSRRPAILTYTSPLVSIGERLATLPLYILGLYRESETLIVPMAESASFSKGWRNVPAYILLELQAGQDLHVYEARILFTARFGGLRWVMYNHRIVSFFIFTTAFWFAEVFFALLGWAVVRMKFGSSPAQLKGDVIKEEDTDASTQIKVGPEDTDEPDLSDTPRTFPTYGRQPPLKYEPKIKDEGDSEDYVIDETAIQPLAVEADDEGEEGLDLGGFRGGRSDSGLGTSFSEGGRSSLTRRRSRGSR